MKTILSFGEILWDVLPEMTVLGGAPLNLAFRLHELGDRGIIVSRVGSDNEGSRAVSRISSFGMDTSFIQRDTLHPTGANHISFDEEMKPSHNLLTGVAYDFIESTPELLEKAHEADCVSYGTLIQRGEIARKSLKKVLSHAERALKFLDLNLRKNCYTEETIVFSLQQADVLKLNTFELEVLTELFRIRGTGIPKQCEHIHRRWNIGVVVVTCGDRGSCMYGDGGFVHIPGYRVNLVDAEGSGDAFSAGFIHHYLRNEPAGECCRFGNVLGALVAMQRGATQPLSLKQIGQFARI